MFAEQRVYLHVSSPLLLPDFNQNLNVSIHLSKTQISDLVRIRSADIQLLHANRQTDSQTWRSKQTHFCHAPIRVWDTAVRGTASIGHVNQKTNREWALLGKFGVLKVATTNMAVF
jgi:hypothetical protein